MNLTPREKDKLLVAMAAIVARRRGRQAPVVFGHADAVGGTAQQLRRLGNAKAHVESLAAFGQKGLAPQALDHSFAGLGQIADLPHDCTAISHHSPV